MAKTNGNGEKVKSRTRALQLVERDKSLVRFYLPIKHKDLQGIIDRVDFNATTHGQRDIDDDRLSKFIEKIQNTRK